MPGQLRYNNAPQPYLFDVSAAFRNAADLINTPLRNFGEVADKITTSIQNQNTNELYRYLASQYDPNNVQSINQALARAAGDNRFSNVGADAWRQATDDYRVRQSELLNKENLALAQRAMDPYQNRINQEAANGSIAGLLAANNAGAQAMLDGKIRSDAIKYGEVDPLRNSASERALRGASADAARARALAARAQAARILRENADDRLLYKMKYDFNTGKTVGSDEDSNAVNVNLLRRIIEQNPGASWKVKNTFLEWAKNSNGDTLITNTPWSETDNMLIGSTPDDITGNSEVNNILAKVAMGEDIYSSGSKSTIKSNNSDVPQIDSNGRTTFNNGSDLTIGEPETKKSIDRQLAEDYAKMYPYAFTGSNTLPDRRESISESTVDKGLTDGLAASQQGNIIKNRQQTAVDVNTVNREAVNNKGLLSGETAQNVAANTRGLLDSYYKAIDNQVGIPGTASVINTALKPSTAPKAVKDFFREAAGNDKKEPTIADLTNQLAKEYSLDDSEKAKATELLSKFSDRVPNEAIVEAIRQNVRYQDSWFSKGNKINTTKVGDQIKAAIEAKTPGNNFNDSLRVLDKASTLTDYVTTAADQVSKLEQEIAELEARMKIYGLNRTEMDVLRRKKQRLQKESLKAVRYINEVNSMYNSN